MQKMEEVSGQLVVIVFVVNKVVRHRRVPSVSVGSMLAIGMYPRDRVALSFVPSTLPLLLVVVVAVAEPFAAPGNPSVIICEKGQLLSLLQPTAPTANHYCQQESIHFLAVKQKRCCS